MVRVRDRGSRPPWQPAQPHAWHGVIYKHNEMFQSGLSHKHLKSEAQGGDVRSYGMVVTPPKTLMHRGRQGCSQDGMQAGRGIRGISGNQVRKE